jgi:tRNA/rRNA methyltransferase
MCACAASAGRTHVRVGKERSVVRNGSPKAAKPLFYMKATGSPAQTALNSPEPSNRAVHATGLPNALQKVRIVLVQPSHPGNIGSVARAMKTMGLSDLRLVAPRFPDALSHSDALALATGAVDVLERARVHATLDDAITDCQWSTALTARFRDLAPIELTPAAAAERAVARAQHGQSVAFVFGNERYGLDNVSVMRCMSCCTIPTSPGYSSLNLAMAVQIVAYECQLAAERATTDRAAPPELGTHAEREQLFAHLEQALVALQFLDPVYNTKLMHRLRRLLSRAELEHDEVNILRGICTAILENRP